MECWNVGIMEYWKIGKLESKPIKYLADKLKNEIITRIIMSNKVKISLLNFLFIIFPLIITAKPITTATVIKVINAKIERDGKGKEFAIKKIIPIETADIICFYAVSLSPAGYMIIAADDDLPPVIAYSFQDNLDPEGQLSGILKQDIALRLANIDKIPVQIIEKRKKQWKLLTEGNSKVSIVTQQWPPTGTTSTGGWLETNWTQNAPYNQMCPIDPVTSTRSYTGCPATAMAQIINYHKTTNNTIFDDGDDYYHNYQGRTFWIDNDFALHGFPSFPQLNAYLDTLNLHYINNIALTNQDKAALTFACGVAATQVFTSEGSGTFSVNQAFDAYQKFNCNTASLLFDGDTTLFPRLIQNMKDSLPAHFAIVDAANTTGHNVVIDGYNTDNYFHVNFGWGGSSNGWYLLPDEMPYGMTVIEGLIVDIMKNNVVSSSEINNISQINIYPNPTHTGFAINIKNYSISGGYTINIINILGQTVLSTFANQQYFQINRSDLGGNGIYLIKITDNKGNVLTIKKIILQ